MSILCNKVQFIISVDKKKKKFYCYKHTRKKLKYEPLKGFYWGIKWLAFLKALSSNSAKDGIKDYETRRKWEHLVTTDTKNYELDLGSENRNIQILLFKYYFVTSSLLCARFRGKKINSRVI